MPAQPEPHESTLEAPPRTVKRTCRFCGESFRIRPGAARGQGCEKCQPPLAISPPVDAAFPAGSGAKR